MRRIAIFPVFFAVGIAWSGCLSLHAQAQEAAPPGAEALKARVERQKGRVEYQKLDETEWKDLKKRIVLKEGDTVVTHPQASALATLLSQSVIILDASTRLTVQQMYKEEGSRKVNVLLDLAEGTILCDVQNLPTDDSRYSVKTPTATAAVRGTQFMVSHLAGVTKIAVLKGAVDVLDSGGRELRLSDRMELDTGQAGGGEAQAAEPATLRSISQGIRAGSTAPLQQAAGGVSGTRDQQKMTGDDLPLDISGNATPAADDDDF